MAIGDEHSQLAEYRFDADAVIGFIRCPDLGAGSLRVVRNHLAVRESEEAAKERGHRISRYIYAVLGDRHERRVIGSRRMPVKLHINAARPLYDYIEPDRVRKWIDENGRSSSARCFERRIHVCDEIPCALRAEGGGYGCQESKKRYCSNRRLQQLRCSFAGRRSHRGNDLLRALPSEGSKKARNERIKVGGGDVDVGSVVLSPHGDGGHGIWTFRRLRPTRERKRRQAQDE